MPSLYVGNLTEECQIIWAGEPKNYTGAAMTSQWASLKNYQHATIIINTGAWAGGTAAVTVNQASAVAGTGSKALALSSSDMPYYWTGTSTADKLTRNALVSSTFNLDTANKLYILELNAAFLDLANGFTSFTAAIASPGANADFYCVTYVLSMSRFLQQQPPSALID